METGVIEIDDIGTVGNYFGDVKTVSGRESEIKKTAIVTAVLATLTILFFNPVNVNFASLKSAK